MLECEQRCGKFCFQNLFNMNPDRFYEDEESFEDDSFLFVNEEEDLEISVCENFGPQDQESSLY